MSGAIVVEGIDGYVPEVRKLRERILVLRDRVFEENNPDAQTMRERVSMPVSQCGRSTEQPEQLFTVNGALRPQIPIAPGERQFWRIVNASPDLYADLQIDGAQFALGNGKTKKESKGAASSVDVIMSVPSCALVLHPKAG